MSSPPVISTKVEVLGSNPRTQSSLTPNLSPRNARYLATRKVTLVGMAVNLTLAAAKIWGGFLAQSQALIADGIHSLSDLASDVFVLYAARHANLEADDDHPYGHERIETLATVVVGVALVIIGAAIAVDALHRLLNPGRLWSPEAWAMLVAAISVACKEGLYRYTLRIAQELRSNLLRANAWHHRSDAASSVIVMIGLGGALLGWPYLDSVAAGVVAVMIGKVGVELISNSIRELIDTGLDEDQLREIRQTILSVDGIKSMHMLRTRQMGKKALVDVHLILTNARLSVSEGHQISERVRGRLIKMITDVEDVTVHIDPEDDEETHTGIHLALRQQVVAQLADIWSDIPATNEIRSITLHYLDGAIHVEVELPLALVVDEATTAALREAFCANLHKYPDIDSVRLLFS